MADGIDSNGPRYDLVVVGAGFAGMYMLHRARALGFTTRVIEAGSGVGGTWYWNRYPGARCDVESVEYCYQFDEELQQEWEWSERYSGQPEILRYANHVADRFDLRTDIDFNTRVTAAAFDETANTWSVSTQSASVGPAAADDSTMATLTARFVVMATGCLSSTNLPDIAGHASFTGESYHTGQWPHEGVDFTGKRVAVIGTGSSAIQSIPEIAKQAAHLSVLQRTAQYAVPARNREADPDYVASVKADYPGFRAANSLMPAGFGARMDVREGSALAVDDATFTAEMEQRWGRGGFAFLSGYDDIRSDPAANKRAADFVRAKIAEIVDDPNTAAKLTPSTTLACKRLVLDSGYFAAYNLPHVELVDLQEQPIHQIVSSGIEVGAPDATETVEVDVIVFATGFDAMTGTLLKIDISGAGGSTLADQWEAGPRTYLGLSVPKIPNMFLVSGPGSPSVLTNMIVSIEQHVDWIADCITYLRDNNHARIEATDPAADEWVDHVNAVADTTLYPTCNSWYLGANIAGKTRVFMPLVGFPPYVEKCNEVANAGYEGFAVT